MNTINLITFYYSIPKLINRIQVEILLIAKTIDDKDGLQDFFNLSASDEDNALINILLKNAAMQEVYPRLAPYGEKLDSLDVPKEGVEFDVTYSDATPPVPNAIVFRMIAPPNFPKAVINPIENIIENILVNYTVKEWFRKNNYAVAGDSHENLLNNNIEDLLSNINRRGGVTKRSYKWY